MATQLATAYVPIVPTVAGIQGELARNIVAPAGTAGDQAGKKLGGNLRSSVLGSMKGMLAAGAALMGGAALAQQLGKAITGAGDLEQSVGAIDSVFKGSSKTMHAWSKNAARDVGLSRNEFNELGTLIGAQLKNGGVAMDELAPKTNNLIGLGADLSSMFGGTTKEAVEALSSALKGESDPIERYGVSVNAAAIESEYLAMGLEKVDGEMTKEGKTAATLSVIMKQTADAHGNFARESDTYAHKVQVFGASWDDLRTKAGTLFLPVLTSVVGFMGDKLLPALDNVGKYVGNVREAFRLWGDHQIFSPEVVARMGLDPDGPLGSAVKEIIGGIRAFGAAWTYNDGEITSSGLPGFMERLGYVARQTFDYVAGTVVPTLVRVGTAIISTVLPPLMALAGWIVEHRAAIGGVLAVVGGFAAGWLAVAGVLKGASMVMVGFRTAILAVRGGIMAVQGALYTARIAVMLFNGALLANPIGLVIGALVALGIGLVIAYNKVGWFKDFVDNAWRVIKSAPAAVLAWWQGTLVPNWNAGLDAIGRAFTWLRDKVVTPVWSAIKTAAAVAAAVLLTIGEGIAWVLDNTYGAAFRFLRDRVVVPVFNAVRNAVEVTRAWLVEKFNAVQTALGVLGSKFRALYDEHVRPVVDWIKTKVEAVRSWFVNTAVPLFVNAITRLGRGYVALWNDYVRPVFDWIKGKVEAVRSWWVGTAVPAITSGADRVGRGFRALWDDYVKPVWDWISSKVRGVWDAIRTRAFDPMVKAIRDTVPGAFRTGVDAIERAWNKVKEIASKPIEFVIDKVINNGFIKHFNNIAGKFGVKRIDPIEWNGFRNGGRTGGSSADEVRGLVHGREFVLTAERTAELDRKYPGLLDDMHRRGAGAIPAHAQYAGPFTPVYGGPRSFGNPLQHAIYRSGVLNVNPVRDMSSWYLDQAIRELDAATSIKVRKGGGYPSPPNTVHMTHSAYPDWWAGVYYDNIIKLNDATMAHAGPAQRKLVTMHELGHALGLPHSARMHGGNGAWSMMNYDNQYMHNSVTAADVAALRAIYGGHGTPGSIQPPGPGGGGGDDGGGILDRLVDKIKDALGLDALLKRIPGAGLMSEIVTGAMRKLWDGIKSWIGKLNPFDLNDDEESRGPGRAGAITSQLFDGGGMLEYSAEPQLISHRTRRPDYVLPEQLFKDMHEAAQAAREDDRAGVMIGTVQGYTADEVAEAIERRRQQRSALRRRR